MMLPATVQRYNFLYLDRKEARPCMDLQPTQKYTGKENQKVAWKNKQSLNN